ncbi:unnamed protein product [Onchocerca flexuosa]|uniref:FH2 domain-containing protein n=1 Tax=Onchocerca flexuosa TaxID=387005 RepID=A0A183H0W6_9BILA|nr:unnamed protein product [Onchocerca flexuosa]
MTMAQRNEMMTDADLLDAIQALGEQEPHDEVKELLSKLFIFEDLKNIISKLFVLLNRNFSGINSVDEATLFVSTDMYQ